MADEKESESAKSAGLTEANYRLWSWIMNDASPSVLRRIRRELLTGMIVILLIAAVDLARDFVAYRITSLSLRLINEPPHLNSPGFSKEQALEDVESDRERIRWDIGTRLCLVVVIIGCFVSARAIPKSEGAKTV
jgi:hypothetical protein